MFSIDNYSRVISTNVPNGHPTHGRKKPHTSSTATKSNNDGGRCRNNNNSNSNSTSMLPSKNNVNDDGSLSNSSETFLDTHQSVALERERNGHCGLCNIQTYSPGPNGQLTPLTIDGVVFHGRCLLCHPLKFNTSSNNSSVCSSFANGSLINGDVVTTTPAVPPKQQPATSDTDDQSQRGVQWDESSHTTISERSVTASIPLSVPPAVPADMLTPSEINSTLDEILPHVSSSLDRNNEGRINLIIKAMTNHPWKAKLLSQCLLVLYSLSSSKRHADAIVSAGGIRAITTTMKQHAENASIVRWGCGCLGQLGDNEIHRDAIAVSGGVRVLIEAMEEHKDDAAVMEKVCTVLGVLGVEDMGGTERRRVMRGVMRASKQHAEVEGVVREACGVLRESAVRREDASFIVAEGGMEEVMTLLASVEGREMAVNVMGLLKLLTEEGEHREEVFEAGGVMGVTRVMEKYLEDGEVVELCMGVLWNVRAAISENDPNCDFGTDVPDPDLDSSNPNPDVHLNINVIVQSMERHRCHIPIQEMGLGILASLATSPDSISSIASSNGISAIIESMNSHPSNALLQEHGCQALNQLSRSGMDGTIIAISSSNGITTIMKAMKNHPRAALVHQFGCSVLMRVSMTKNKVILNNLVQSIPTIVKSMEMHMDETEMQAAAISTLYNLSLTDKNKSMVISAGGLDAILEVMKRPSHSPKYRGVMMDKSILTLKVFSHDVKSMEDILLLGGLTSLILSLKQHDGTDATTIKNSNTAILSLDLICDLCSMFQSCHADYYDTVNGDCMIQQQADLIRLSSQILSQHPQDLSVQETGLIILRHICSHVTECRSILCSVSDFDIYSRFAKPFQTAVEVVVEALRRHGSDVVRGMGFKVLRNISQVKSPRNHFSLDRGIYDVIIDALDVAYDNDEVKANALMIMEHVIFDGKGNTFRFEKVNVVRCIRTILVDRNTSPALLQSASHIFHRFSEDEDNTSLAATEANINAILDTITTQASQEDVQKQMVSILHRMCKDDDILCKIAKAGGLGVLMDVVKCHLDSSNIIRRSREKNASIKRRKSFDKNGAKFKRKSIDHCCSLPPSLTENRAQSCRVLQRNPSIRNNLPRQMSSMSCRNDDSDDISVSSVRSAATFMSRGLERIASMRIIAEASIEDLVAPEWCPIYDHGDLIENAMCLLTRLAYRKGDEYKMKVRASKIKPFLEQLRSDKKYKLKMTSGARKDLMALWKMVNTCT